MNKMLFQGLNIMEGSAFGIILQVRELLWDKLCRHYESKTGFFHGQIESKMPQKRDISAAHTCTCATYYRQCLPRDFIV